MKDLPKSMPMPKGGILADEMGLGKTVEVLSCMLCNPRTDIPKPEPLEVINIFKESRKRRLRRTPSPTEFHLYENEDKDLGVKYLISSPLVPSKQEKNELVLLSYYTF